MKRAWRLTCQLGILGGVVAAAIHCGSDGGSTFDNGANTTACTTAYVGKCGVSCTDDTGCAAGLYCNTSKVCTADCAPGLACTNGGVCSSTGTCVTSGGFGDAGTILSDGAVLQPDGNVCASTTLTLTKTEPYVLFVLDQSSSMYLFKFPGEDVSSNNCASGCRWTELKKALIGADDNDPNGLIKKLQGTAQMAIAMYSATDSNTNDGDNTFLPANAGAQAVCPRFNGKGFATAFPNGLTFSDSNFQEISNLLRPASVDDDTPTGYALQTLAGLSDAGTIVDPKGFAALDAGAAPKVIVLVTDGLAGNCVNAQNSDNATGDSQQTAGFNKTRAVVQSIFAQNIRTYVIDIGNPSINDQFKQIANAGQGKDLNNGDATAIAPSNTTALSNALASIVTGARSCTVALNGTVVGDGSSGTVTVNGQTVPFGSGWKLASPTSIELLGDACNTLKTQPDATLSAVFPCGTVTDIK